MKIENMGVKISKVPYLGEIVIADGRARIDDGDTTWHADVEQLREMRDALDAAIRELEKSSASEPSAALFHVGQMVDGGELLPIGAVVKDSDPSVRARTEWTCGPEGYSLYGLGGTTPLREIVRNFAPVTIVSLP